MNYYIIIDSTAKPKWDFTLSSNSVPEDAPNGTLIGKLALVSGPSGSYMYRVADVRQPFRVVGTELVLVYSQPLDYETSNSTTVVIVSTNSEGISARKSFIITITSECKLFFILFFDYLYFVRLF